MAFALKVDNPVILLGLVPMQTIHCTTLCHNIAPRQARSMPHIDVRHLSVPLAWTYNTSLALCKTTTCAY